ncbi:MAG: hypothetical protein LC640_06625, partial [Frankia sp.]|nr:hypothetical protein [Frankia sp.]
MPVVVTGADEPLGRRVVDLLLAAGADYEVRAVVDDPAIVAPLVARGVKTAVADFDELVRFGAV